MPPATQTYIIDFDSTLITLESLDELARITLAGRSDASKVMNRLEAITKQGMLGDIEFDKSLTQRLSLFSANKQHIERLTELLMANISPSALSNTAWFRENAERIYVVSGGFADYIVPVVASLGLIPKHVFANNFVYDELGNIKGYNPDSLLSRPQGKVQQIKSLGLPDTYVVMIGDGYTDFEAKAYGAADEFWAFTETANRPKVDKLADRIVRDFEEVAKLSRQ
ncbi:MAG: HAD-IB family phosphatase [Patescibacteria group bacterium]